MYDYGIKSIHDQKMRQFMIEAERARLIRQLRKNQPQRLPFLGRLATVANGVRQALGRRPQPTV